MYFYSLHVLVTIQPGNMVTTAVEQWQQRFVADTPTPIEYANDLDPLEEKLASQCLSNWRDGRRHLLADPADKAFVQILSWQPLKGYERPEDEKLA